MTEEIEFLCWMNIYCCRVILMFLCIFYCTLFIYIYSPIWSFINFHLWNSFLFFFPLEFTEINLQVQLLTFGQKIHRKPLYRMWEAYRQRYLGPTRGCKNDWWAQQRPKDACAARNQRRDSDHRNDNKLEIFFSVTARHWHSNSRTWCVGVIPPYMWSARNDTYFFIIGTTIFYIFRRKLKNIRYGRVKNSRYTGFINNRYKL